MNNSRENSAYKRNGNKKNLKKARKTPSVGDVSNRHYNKNQAYDTYREREAARTANSSKHKKKKRGKQRIYYLMLALFVIIAGMLLSVTVFFNVENITVNESVYYNLDDIIITSEIKQGDNLFRISEKVVEQRIINHHLYIDSVKVKKIFPTGIEIEISDAEIDSNVKYAGERYAYVSRKGRVLETEKFEPFPGIKIINGLDAEGYIQGEFIYNNDSFRYTVYEKLNAELSNIEFSDITEIDISDTSNLVILYQDRLRIELGDSTDLPYKLRGVLQLVTTEIYSDEKGKIIYIKSGTSNRFNFIPSRDEEGNGEEVGSEPVSSELGIESETESQNEEKEVS